MLSRGERACLDQDRGAIVVLMTENRKPKWLISADMKTQIATGNP
jgi:hypothetical protein